MSPFSKESGEEPETEPLPGIIQLLFSDDSNEWVIF